MVKTFRILQYDITHHLPLSSESKELEIILELNKLPKVDGMLAKYDESDHLTIFEMEILLMMLRKKVDHIGIMAALQPSGQEVKEADPNMYK